MMTVTAALAAGGLLAGGGVALASTAAARTVRAFAGGLLAALAGVDLLPDAVADGRVAGMPAPGLVAVAAVGFAVPVAVAEGGCCSPRVGRFAVTGLALHGFLEGAVLGLGLGVVPAPVLLTAFCLHKFGEGFALVGLLRPGGTGRVRRWLGVAAVAPPAGALAGGLVTVPESVAPPVAAALAGLLLAVAALLIRGAGWTSAAVWAALASGVAVMGVATGLAG